MRRTNLNVLTVDRDVQKYANKTADRHRFKIHNMQNYVNSSPSELNYMEYPMKNDPDPNPDLC